MVIRSGVASHRKYFRSERMDSTEPPPHHHTSTTSNPLEMRLPYIEKDTKFANAEDQAIVERVRQRRGSAGLIELDRALLHAPPVADGW
jgi:hypothetical protein